MVTGTNTNNYNFLATAKGQYDFLKNRLLPNLKINNQLENQLNNILQNTDDYLKEQGIGSNIDTNG